MAPLCVDVLVNLRIDNWYGAAIVLLSVSKVILGFEEHLSTYSLGRGDLLRELCSDVIKCMP